MNEPEINELPENPEFEYCASCRSPVLEMAIKITSATTLIAILCSLGYELVLFMKN